MKSILIYATILIIVFVAAGSLLTFSQDAIIDPIERGLNALADAILIAALIRAGCNK